MAIIVHLIHAGSEEDHVYVCSVPICEFVEYVNNKHSDVNIQFEREFNVIYVNYSTMENYNYYIILQLLSSVPGSSHDESRLPCNSEKNRFCNIFPCMLYNIMCVANNIIILYLVYSFKITNLCLFVVIFR